jgi:hypothetical protein
VLPEFAQRRATVAGHALLLLTTRHAWQQRRAVCLARPQ